MDQNYFIDGLTRRGMAPHIAEGFVWNFQDESGLNPGINEIAPIVPGSRGGFGLSQWTGPRRRALESFAAQNGRDVADPDLQMDFLMTELSGGEAGAWEKISGAQSAPEAAAAVVNYFLRPSEEHRARRESKYLGGKAPTYGGQSYGGNALATGQPQAPQNALKADEPQAPTLTNALDPRAFAQAARMNYTPI